jgi:K+-sensing histidine kinase KdpD
LHIYARTLLLSHELYSPLTASLGWTQLLTRPGVDSARQAMAISGIEHSGQLLTRLADDLVCAARIGSGCLAVERHSTMLDPVIASSVAALIPAAPKTGASRLAETE